MLITTRAVESPLLRGTKTFSRNEWLRGKRVGPRLIGLCGARSNNEMEMLREEPPSRESGRKRFVESYGAVYLIK